MELDPGIFLTEELGFHSLLSEQSAFTHGSGDSYNVITIHGDDQTIISPNEELLRIFKGELKAMFVITDLGVLSYTPGLEAKWTESTVLLPQKKYARTIVDRLAKFLPGKLHVPMYPIKGPDLSIQMGPDTAAGEAIMAKLSYRS